MQSYRADLDGLRALAVLAIVGYHAFPSLVLGGFVGVDIFFVISGFLITGIIARDFDAKRFSWGGFYLRRARRILPALVVVSLITAGLAAWIEIPHQLIATGIALLASAWFGANLTFAQTQGYFAPGAQQNPFLHLWSLGVEEQFYLVWPFLIAAIKLSIGWNCAGESWLRIGPGGRDSNPARANLIVGLVDTGTVRGDRHLRSVSYAVVVDAPHRERSVQ
jgi:peptidoglycan/LPS O-acetylase OafA/YrhL